MRKHKRLIFLIALLALVLVGAAVDVKNSGMRADNGRLLNPVGTVALPGVILNGDPNTGLYQIAGDNIGWSAGGDLRFDVAPLGVTITRNDCQTTYFPSLDLMNNTAATVGQTQFSPSAWFDAKAWNTNGAGSSEVSTFIMTNEPTNGNPPLSELTIGHRRAALAATQMAKFNSTGDLNLTDDLTCNQATMTVDGITALTAPSVTTAVASDGILLRNTTPAGGTQEFSPSLRLDGTGYTNPTYTRQSWAITNKPTSATAGKIAFDFASAGGVWAEKASIDSDGKLTLQGLISASSYQMAGNWLIASSPVDGMAVIGYNGLSNYAIGLWGQLPAAPTTIGAIIGSTTDITATEGARIATFHAKYAGGKKSSIDKDGAYHQGYASGQVTDAVPSLALTLVTAMDDDTIYDVQVGCQYIGYAAGVPGTPTYHFSSVIGASFIRIDGVASEVGANTVISHKEDVSAACVPCAVSFTNGAADTINVTFTQCHLDADVANVKAWISSMHKTNITQPFTGVNQPAAN